MQSFLFHYDDVTRLKAGDMAKYNKITKTLAFSRKGERLYFGICGSDHRDDKLSLQGVDITIIIQCYTTGCALRAVRDKNTSDDMLVWRFENPS
ncbi:MAG: hypothetical protein RLZZ230_203 [Candidatus Parcubacteria bacterium]|jgi:hypothetical protein